MATVKTITITESGVNVAADSVVLGSSDGSYGIKRTSDSVVVVPYGTAVDNTSVGVYEYDISGLVVGTQYTISWKITSVGVTQYATETFIYTGIVSSDGMTLSQVKEKAIKLINFYSISGNLISTSDPSYLDYSLRMNSLIDAAQKEIATTSKSIRKTTRISQKPIPSQLDGSNYYNFDIVQHTNEDIIYSAEASRAYTFKVDNVADIYIEQSNDDGTTWTTTQTINHLSPTGEFIEYKNLITLSEADNLVRIRFSGNYVYNLRDVALFEYTFPNAASIPQYRSYNEYTMPSDFYKLVKVTTIGNVMDSRTYRPQTQFYWSQRNVLVVKYYDECELDIEYNAYPTTINDYTSDDTTLEIDIEAQEAVPYYVAAHLMMDENGNINNKLFAMYQGKLSNLQDDKPNGATQIVNSLFSSSNSNTFLNNYYIKVY
jgi:hypothetical protein